MYYQVGQAIFLVLSLIAMASLQSPTTVPEPELTTESSSVNHTEVLAAGSKLLDHIAMGKLAATMGMPDNTSIFTGERSELQVALTTMCNLRESYEALWDLSVGKTNEMDTLLRKMVHRLIQPTCNWVKILLSEQNVTHMLACVSEDIDRVCRDYRTLSFSKELQAAVADHSNAAALLSQSEWVSSYVEKDKVLPEVYQDILSFATNTN